MIISGISGADSVNFIPRITAQSFGRVAPVKPYQREEEPLPAEFTPSDEIFALQADDLLTASVVAQPLENKPLAEPGRAYGRPAGELRRQGFMHQLTGSAAAGEEAIAAPDRGASVLTPTSGAGGAGADASGAQSATPAGASVLAYAPPVNEDEESATGEEATEEDGSSGQSADVRRKPDGQPLNEEDLRMIQELEQRDREVRQHEMTHVAAGGAYVTGGPSYDYQNGPDGKRYAVGGEVQIDTSPEATPEATIAKMRTVRAAALAPAQPSGQDRSVAASAASAEMQARQELMEQQQSEAPTEGGEEVAQADEAAQDGGLSPQGRGKGGLSELTEAMTTLAGQQQAQTPGVAGAADATGATGAASNNGMAGAAGGVARLNYQQLAALTAYGLAG